MIPDWLLWTSFPRLSLPAPPPFAILSSPAVVWVRRTAAGCWAAAMIYCTLCMHVAASGSPCIRPASLDPTRCRWEVVHPSLCHSDRVAPSSGERLPACLLGRNFVALFYWNSTIVIQSPYSPDIPHVNETWKGTSAKVLSTSLFVVLLEASTSSPLWTVSNDVTLRHLRLLMLLLRDGSQPSVTLDAHLQRRRRRGAPETT